MEQESKKGVWREPDWEFLDFISRIKDEWQEELMKTLPKTETEWLKIFPEAKKIIPIKIKELEQQAETARLLIYKAVKSIEKKEKKENHQLLIEDLKYNFPPIYELAQVKKHIQGLGWLIQKKKKSKAGVSESEIASAKEKDLVHITETYGFIPKKSGQIYKILCPQHNERTPSFCIYPPARYYCFGCQIHGDQISFVRMMDECSFVDAVRKLQII